MSIHTYNRPSAPSDYNLFMKTALPAFKKSRVAEEMFDGHKERFQFVQDTWAYLKAQMPTSDILRMVRAIDWNEMYEMVTSSR